MVEHTGSKWNPEIVEATEQNGGTFLAFDSAWSPPNALLRQLHQLTGWTIHNTFEEEWPQFEGDFHAEEGNTWEDLRDWRPRCSCCEERFSEDELEPDYGECPTCALGRSDYLVTLKPDIAAKLALKQTESFDLEGNVVLGLYSVRTLEHAYTQGIARLPEEAFGDVDIYSDPEGFGFRAYRLAKEGE